MGFGLEDLQAFLTNEAPAAMEEEQAKGADSTAPEDAMAMISALKDHLTGGGPVTRASTSAAAGQDLNSITARKAALNEQLATTGKMTSSQTVGLAVLALGLMGAAAAVKGKRGLAMGAGALGVGGKVFLDSEKANAAAANKSTIAQINALNAQEKDLTKLVQDNAMAPIKREEAIGQQVEARDRMVKAGLVNPNGNQTKVMIPDIEARKRLEGAREAVSKISKVEKMLQKNFPIELSKGESYLEAAVRLGQGEVQSEGAQKELNSLIEGIIIANGKSLGGNPSDKDAQRIAKQITGGGVYSIPFLASRLQSMKEDASDRVENILGTGKILGEEGGYNTSPESILRGADKTEQDEENLIPEELRPDTPKKPAAPAKKTIGSARSASKEITYQGKRGKLIDGVFHPYAGQ